MALKILGRDPLEPTWRYLVQWTIQVEARTPEEAAYLAAKIIRDPASLSQVFEVRLEETIEVPWPDEALPDVLEEPPPTVTVVEGLEWLEADEGEASP